MYYSVSMRSIPTPNYLKPRLISKTTTRAIVAVVAATELATSLASAELYSSHTLFVDAQSTSDGNGNFTYTFWGSSSNPDFSFYLTPDSGTIAIQAYGVIGVQTPPGWQASVDDGGLVTLQYSDPQGVWIRDAPIVFSLSSSIRTTTLYDGLGVVSGPFCQNGNPDNGGWGTQTFSYLGPIMVPEPEPIAFGVMGIIIFVLASFKRSGKTRALRRSLSVATLKTRRTSF